MKNINRVIYYKESQNENIIEYKNHIKNIINLENLEIYINSLNSEKKVLKIYLIRMLEKYNTSIIWMILQQK